MATCCEDPTPQSIDLVRAQELESNMNDLYKQQLIPRQKDAFLCSARCCDSSNDMGDLQKWWALVLDGLLWHACCHSASSAWPAAAVHPAGMPCGVPRRSSICMACVHNNDVCQLFPANDSSACTLLYAGMLSAGVDIRLLPCSVDRCSTVVAAAQQAMGHHIGHFQVGYNLKENLACTGLPEHTHTLPSACLLARMLAAERSKYHHALVVYCVHDGPSWMPCTHHDGLYAC